MFQNIFQGIIDSLPSDPEGVIITTLVAVGIGLGAITALLGALHSRSTMSLMMFALGTILGYMLPAWLNMDVNRSIAIAVTGIVFSLIGFLLHRWCVAFALGTLITGVAILILYYQTSTSSVPAADQSNQTSASVQQVMRDHWQTASPTFKKLAPWVAPGAFVVAVLFSLALPKFGMAALYALGGTLLTLFSIGLGHASDKITWLDSLKNGPMTVAALGITMLLVGFLAQVALVYRPVAKQPNAREDAKRHTPDLE